MIPTQLVTWPQSTQSLSWRVIVTLSSSYIGSATKWKPLSAFLTPDLTSGRFKRLQQLKAIIFRIFTSRSSLLSITATNLWQIPMVGWLWIERCSSMRIMRHFSARRSTMILMETAIQPLLLSTSRMIMIKSPSTCSDHRVSQPTEREHFGSTSID